MSNAPPLFTRSQIQEMTGLDAQSIDYWSRNGILRPASGGGGKGQHRKFDSTQVTLGRILGELQKLGINGNALKGVAGQFPQAVDWFSQNGFIGQEEAAASLIEYRHDIECLGFASVPDGPSIERLGKDIPFDDASSGEVNAGGKRRRLTWDQIVVYHREVQNIGTIDDSLIERSRTAGYDEFMAHRDRYFAVSAAKASLRYVNTLYFYNDPDHGWSVCFEKEQFEAMGYATVDLTRLKRELWRWP